MPAEVYRVGRVRDMVTVHRGRKGVFCEPVADTRALARQMLAECDAIAPRGDVHPFDPDPVGACRLCGQRADHPDHDPDWSQP